MNRWAYKVLPEISHSTCEHWFFCSGSVPAQLQWPPGYRTATTVSHTAVLHSPIILQSSLSVGASLLAPVAPPPYWFNMPFCTARGSGIVSVIGRWNFRRRGSIVTIGLTATRLPSIRDTRLAGTGCACSITRSSMPVWQLQSKAVQIRVHGTTNQPDTKSNPNPNRTAKQHAIVNIHSLHSIHSALKPAINLGMEISGMGSYSSTMNTF